MILCDNRTDVNGWGGRTRVGNPSPNRNYTAGGEVGEVSISKLCNKTRKRLDPEWSMYEVGTSTPHNLYKYQGLVDSNKYTHT